MFLAPPLALSACAGPLSALDPAGPQAEVIARLWWAMLAGSAALFALVFGAWLWALRRPGAAAAVTPQRWIFWGGIVLPLPVLALLLAAGFAGGDHLLRLPSGAPPLQVEARAAQWQWRFAYPGHPQAAAEPGVLRIPAGRVVEVTAVSDDVIHAFWVPRLGGKIDATPGRETRIRLRADAPGDYGGQCAEYCGAGHPDMSFIVIALPEAEFARFLEGEAP